MGGATNSSGRLEVCANGMWGRVCNALRYWGPDNARVVCHQLGFSVKGITLISLNIQSMINVLLFFSLLGASFLSESIFGSGDGHFRIGEIHCTGHEKKLLECSHNSIGDHLCHDASADVSVWCYGTHLNSYQAK